MADRIATHVFQDGGKCLHCGAEPDSADKSCIYRDAPPRPVPVSIFADLAEIGTRQREIAAEEDKALAGKS